MRAVMHRIHANASLMAMLQWGRLVTVAGFSQALVQTVGFICGVVVIRLLPTEQYALYILAHTMVGTMSVLADGGISTGVTARGGRVWQDPEKLGAVLATGLDLRMKFGVISMTIALPVMYLLLINHHAGSFMSVLIIIAVIPAFFSTLSGSLLQVAPKLQQDIFLLQKNQVIAHLMRLALLAATLFYLPFAFVAILAGSVPQIWSNMRLKAISLKYAYWRQNPDAGIRREILRFVKNILPGSIYFCISGQLTLWLISIFGSTSAIAHVGALTRLATVLTLFNILLGLLVIPRFARLSSNRRMLVSWYIKIQTCLIVFCGAITGVAWLFPHEMLWILGSPYAGLHHELLLCFVGGGLNLWVGVNYALNTSRGWLINPVVAISVGIFGIVGGLLLVDVSTIEGVLWFNIFTGVVGLFVHPLYGLLKIWRSDDETVQ